MNLIFGIVFLISLIFLLFTSPDKVLASMLLGGEKSLSLTLKMVVSYAVWLGVFEILDKTGLSNKIARLLKPVNRVLFGKIPDKASEYISLNISSNMLGMSGATTPLGIKAIEELEKHKGTSYATYMFFVINATSVQLIPTSVLAIRTSMGALSPSDIILPTILSTALSTVIGVLLVRVFMFKKAKNV